MMALYRWRYCGHSSLRVKRYASRHLAPPAAYTALQRGQANVCGRVPK